MNTHSLRPIPGSIVSRSWRLPRAMYPSRRLQCHLVLRSSKALDIVSQTWGRPRTRSDGWSSPLTAGGRMTQGAMQWYPLSTAPFTILSNTADIPSTVRSFSIRRILSRISFWREKSNMRAVTPTAIIVAYEVAKGILLGPEA